MHNSHCIMRNKNNIEQPLRFAQGDDTLKGEKNLFERSEKFLNF